MSLPPPAMPPLASLRAACRAVVAGNDSQIDQLIACVLTGHHAVLTGDPGCGKSTLATVVAERSGLARSRVQGTDELWPSDIVGSVMWNPARNEFEFHRGPIFSEFVVIDEVTRIPPRAQAALLEAMADRNVTTQLGSHSLPTRFVCVATANTSSNEVYGLSGALADRFALGIAIERVRGEAEQVLLVRLTDATHNPPTLCPATSAFRFDLPIVHVQPRLVKYAQDLATPTRQRFDESALSTRALSQWIGVAKGMALLAEREFLIPEDLTCLLESVIRRRAPGIDATEVADDVLNRVGVPK